MRRIDKVVLHGQLEKVVDLTRQWLEQQGGIVDGRTRWATIEQSPEQGRRKRKIRGEAATARQIMPMGCDIDEAATFWSNTTEISRYDFNTNWWLR